MGTDGHRFIGGADIFTNKRSLFPLAPAHEDVLSTGRNLCFDLFVFHLWQSVAE
jgi:hypothetical protein